MKPRKICYITGTRADFGLMQSTLQRIHQCDALELSIVVTGMHLLPEYGATEHEITAAQLPITARVPVQEGTSSGAWMVKNVGRMIVGITEALESIAPDVVMVLGDRGEMLAGALAAVHLDIPVVHVHGGERSGTVDEPVRHAISKLAHFHLVATEESRERLMRMGEVGGRIRVVGAPGLDGLKDLVVLTREQLSAAIGFDPTHSIALMVYHPVLQEAHLAGTQANLIIDALRAMSMQVIALKPNSDAGSSDIGAVLESRAATGDVHLVTHLPRPRFVSSMAAADVLIGNSSSGIIEAATFGTPVVNIGSRQNLRQRNINVIDSVANRESVQDALVRALSMQRVAGRNVYGDGAAGRRIVDLLAEINLSEIAVMKSNAY